jgi:RNA polymerase sigma factor (sigma-70 family)
MSDPPTPHPTPDERRHAACLAMGKAPGLIRFAARYTRSLHDAEDAYQRTMEIALSRAPVTDTPRFMAWLHTVLRHEALAVARTRRRESPGREIDVAETVADRVEDDVAIDALAEWRERYRSIQDGLAGLTEAQRTCLILQSSGASYDRIGELTGYSRRKVERSVLEGRASLRSWEVRLASGEVCERMGSVIDRVAQGEATARERRSVTRHVRHCGPCRALLRDRRESNEWLANLVPLALISGEALLRTPDPSPALAWWDRIATGATVRAGTVVQMALDMPSSALAKIGAGTAAVAVAGAAGAPLIIDDVVRPAAPQPSVAALQAPATSARTAIAPLPKTSPARADAALATFAAARRQAANALATRRARERRQASISLPKHPDPVPASTTPSPSVPRVVVSAPAASPRPAPASASAPASSASEVAIEFGP